MIECSWDTFAKQLLQATSLDDIIAAHNHFVDSVRHGTLLDEKSQVSIGLKLRKCIRLDDKIYDIHTFVGTYGSFTLRLQSNTGPSESRGNFSRARYTGV